MTVSHITRWHVIGADRQRPALGQLVLDAVDTVDRKMPGAAGKDLIYEVRCMQVRETVSQRICGKLPQLLECNGLMLTHVAKVLRLECKLQNTLFNPLGDSKLGPLLFHNSNARLVMRRLPPRNRYTILY